jgi:glucose dehydrogenase
MMTRAVLGSLVLAMAALAALSSWPPVIHGQAGTTSGEWRTYGGDHGHTRYAALDQINAGNFNKLARPTAWVPVLNFNSNPRR